MKNYIFIFLVTFASPLPLWACDLFDQYHQEGFELDNHYYTPFWSREFVGADLVRKEMEQIRWRTNVPFTIIDAGFHPDHINLELSPEALITNGEDSHGTCVANIINGKGPYGISSNVEYRRLLGASFSFSASDKVDEMIEDGDIPRIISHSMDWSSAIDLAYVKKLTAYGTIWVTSSGNNFPKAMNQYKEAAKIITVGSRHPNTFVSLFSQESPKLTITAPSEHHVATIGENGEHRMFGQTSAATPIVSGSLANVVALLPDLTMEEAKTLLVKTALPAPNQILMGDLNPAGIVNSYKLFRVAKSIALKCGYNNLVVDSSARSRCRHKMINDEKTYHNLIVPFVRNKMLQEISSLGKREQVKNDFSCNHTKHLFHQLRRIAFLEPHNAALWEQLSTVAGEYNYDGHADFYKNIALVNLKQSPKKLAKTIAIKGCYAGVHKIRELQATFSMQDWTDVFVKILQGPYSFSCYESSLDSIFILKLQDQRLGQILVSTFGNKKKSLEERLLAARVLEGMKVTDNALFDFIAKDSLEAIDVRIYASLLAKGSGCGETLKMILADKKDSKAFASSSIKILFGNHITSLNKMVQYSLYNFISDSQNLINWKRLALNILERNEGVIESDILDYVSGILINEKSDLDLKLASFDILDKQQYGRLPHSLISIIQNIEEKLILRNWALDQLKSYKPLAETLVKKLEEVSDEATLVAKIKDFLHESS